MKSIFSIFVAAVCFSPCQSAEAHNYSLWPRRPDDVTRAFELLDQGGEEREALKLLEPHLQGYGIGGREARKIAGRINAGKYLSGHMPGMALYTVKSGDNLFKIADRMKCPVDILMYANGMLEPSALKIGQKLKVPALNCRMEIRPDTNEIVVWDGSILVACYPVLQARLPGSLPAEGRVLAREAFLDGQPVIRNSPDYASADKELVLAESRLRIASRPLPSGDVGLQLSAADANELSLLIVPGNKVTVVREGEGVFPRRETESGGDAANG